MKDYPLHHHNTHIVHPKGANIKHCPHCMEEKPFDNCIIKDKAIWFNNQIIAKIKNCPMCGKKL